MIFRSYDQFPSCWKISLWPGLDIQILRKMKQSFILWWELVKTKHDVRGWEREYSPPMGSIVTKGLKTNHQTCWNSIRIIGIVSTRTFVNGESAVDFCQLSRNNMNIEFMSWLRLILLKYIYIIVYTY
jgi:hypothetical protein